MQVYQQNITPEEILQKPECRYCGEIVIVDSEDDIQKACDYLSEQSVLGFDTETRPSFTAGKMNKVALLQLASFDKCYLFRLNKMKLDKPILKILENRDIIKVGADIGCDLRALQQLRHFKPGGFEDLQSLAGKYGIEAKSLRKLTAIILNGRISKAQRLSNWEAVVLTPAQQRYAATDAWVCHRIYEILNSWT